MDGQMNALTRYEVSRLMEKFAALDVGEVLYQHYLSALPPTSELRDLANGISPDMDFAVHDTINGYTFRRTR